MRLQSHHTNTGKTYLSFYYLQVQCLLLVMKSRYISINYKLVQYTVDDTVHKPVIRRNIENQNCPMQKRWSHLLVCPQPVIRNRNIKYQATNWYCCHGDSKVRRLLTVLIPGRLSRCPITGALLRNSIACGNRPLQGERVHGWKDGKVFRIIQDKKFQ